MEWTDLCELVKTWVDGKTERPKNDLPALWFLNVKLPSSARYSLSDKYNQKLLASGRGHRGRYYTAKKSTAKKLCPHDFGHAARSLGFLYRVEHDVITRAVLIGHIGEQVGEVHTANGALNIEMPYYLNVEVLAVFAREAIDSDSYPAIAAVIKRAVVYREMTGGRRCLIPGSSSPPGIPEIFDRSQYEGDAFRMVPHLTMDTSLASEIVEEYVQAQPAKATTSSHTAPMPAKSSPAAARTTAQKSTKSAQKSTKSSTSRASRTCTKESTKATSSSAVTEQPQGSRSTLSHGEEAEDSAYYSSDAGKSAGPSTSTSSKRLRWSPSTKFVEKRAKYRKRRRQASPIDEDTVEDDDAAGQRRNSLKCHGDDDIDPLDLDDETLMAATADDRYSCTVYEAPPHTLMLGDPPVSKQPGSRPPQSTVTQRSSGNASGTRRHMAVKGTHGRSMSSQWRSPSVSGSAPRSDYAQSTTALKAGSRRSNKRVITAEQRSKMGAAVPPPLPSTSTAAYIGDRVTQLLDASQTVEPANLRSVVQQLAGDESLDSLLEKVRQRQHTYEANLRLMHDDISAFNKNYETAVTAIAESAEALQTDERSSDTRGV